MNLIESMNRGFEKKYGILDSIKKNKLNESLNENEIKSLLDGSPYRYVNWDINSSNPYITFYFMKVGRGSNGGFSSAFRKSTGLRIAYFLEPKLKNLGYTISEISNYESQSRGSSVPVYDLVKKEKTRISRDTEAPYDIFTLDITFNISPISEDLDSTAISDFETSLTFNHEKIPHLPFKTLKEIIIPVVEDFGYDLYGIDNGSSNVRFTFKVNQDKFDKSYSEDDLRDEKTLYIFYNKNKTQDYIGLYIWKSPISNVLKEIAEKLKSKLKDLNLSTTVEMNKDIIYLKLPKKLVNEGYSKRGFSWEERKGIIYIYEDGKLKDKFSSKEKAKDAGWDLKLLKEDYDDGEQDSVEDYIKNNIDYSSRYKYVSLDPNNKNLEWVAQEYMDIDTAKEIANLFCEYFKEESNGRSYTLEALERDSNNLYIINFKSINGKAEFQVEDIEEKYKEIYQSKIPEYIKDYIKKAEEYVEDGYSLEEFIDYIVEDIKMEIDLDLPDPTKDGVSVYDYVNDPWNWVEYEVEDWFDAVKINDIIKAAINPYINKLEKLFQ